MAADASEPDDTPADKINLIDHYVSFLLQIFIKAGLVDVRRSPRSC